MWDRFFRRLGESLTDDQRRSAFFSRIFRLFRKATLVISLAYVGGLILLVALLSGVGENNVTLAATLYLPRVIFLLPLVGLAPLALVFHRLSAGLLLAGGTFFWIFGMGYSPRFAPPDLSPAAAGEITVMTYNRGQNMNQSLQPFKTATRPDIIAFQESAGRARRFANAAGYEDLPHTADAGEFTLLSRFPILSGQRIDFETEGAVQRPAARFEIDFNGQRVALYSVHVMSPRGTLLSYRGGAFFYGIVGYAGTPWEEHRKAHQAYWDGRIEITRKLLDEIAKDSLPALVVGDFNAPSGGYIHRMVRSRLGDAHTEVGKGFGYSFPGKSSNPLSGGGPWIRIDYLFYEEAHWSPLWCITEPDRQSQHRAVVARFRLTGSGIPTESQGDTR